MRLPPCLPSQGNCSRQEETRCRPRSFFPPRSARETEEMEKWSFQRTRELMTPRALRGIAVNEIGRVRISMMVRSMSSNSRPDTLVQDRTPQPHRFLLQRTAGPYIGVNICRNQTVCVMSVQQPITDSCRTSRRVGSGPTTEVEITHIGAAVSGMAKEIKCRSALIDWFAANLPIAGALAGTIQQDSR
jgi:hypothetical protein